MLEAGAASPLAPGVRAMRHRLTPFRVRAALVGLLVLLPAMLALSRARSGQAPRELPRSSQAWTLAEAQDQLELTPHDPYVQYVALQLARREGRVNELAGDITRRQARDTGRPARNTGRAADVNLF